MISLPQAMRDEHLQPNEVTFTSIVSACAGALRCQAAVCRLWINRPRLPCTISYNDLSTAERPAVFGHGLWSPVMPFAARAPPAHSRSSWPCLLLGSALKVWDLTSDISNLGFVVGNQRLLLGFAVSLVFLVLGVCQPRSRLRDWNPHAGSSTKHC